MLNNVQVISLTVGSSLPENYKGKSVWIEKTRKYLFWSTAVHTVGNTPLFDKFDPQLFIIVDSGDMDRKQNPAAQQMLNDLVEHGYVANGRKYIPIFAGSSQMRNGEFVICDENYREEIIEWCSLGLNLRKLNVSKISKYLALMMSTVKAWTDVFEDVPAMEYPHPSTWAVLDDAEAPAIGMFDVVTPNSVNRTLKFAEDGEVNKFTDGYSIYLVDDAVASKGDLSKLDACTFRSPMCKGSMHPAHKSAIKKYMEDNGYSPIVHDVWGNEVNLLDKKVITFKSVVKCWKALNSWSEYVERFDEYKHRVWVCIQAHGKKASDLPYQQLQTLDAEEDEIEYFARLAASQLLDNAEVCKVGKIIGGNLGKAIDLNPIMLSDTFVQDQLAHKWVSMVKKMYGGRIPRIAHNLVCAPDIAAVIDFICGAEPKGLIKANEVRCNLYEDGQKLGCSRCPHLDNAWHVVHNAEIKKRYTGLYVGTSLYFSVHDNAMKLMQMDYDGDKCKVVNNCKMIALMERSHLAYNDTCLLYAAMDDGNKQAGCKNYEEEFKELCKNSFKAPIGIYANTLTKAWGLRKMLKKDSAESRKLWKYIKCLTRKGNTCIDEAGGHGKDTSNGIAETAVGAFAEIGKPSFIAIAKGKIIDNKIEPQPGDGFEFNPNHVVDKYSTICKVLVPESVDESFKNPYAGLDDNETRGKVLRPMMSNPVISGLAKKLIGLIDIKNFSGMFGDLVSAAASEESLIMENSSLAAVPDFKLDKAKMIELKVAEFALDRHCTLDEAVDYLAYVLFYRKTITNVRMFMLKRWFFIVFGDRILNNMRINLENNNLDDVLYEEDEEEDENEEYDE